MISRHFYANCQSLFLFFAVTMLREDASNQILGWSYSQKIIHLPGGQILGFFELTRRPPRTLNLASSCIASGTTEKQGHRMLCCAWIVRLLKHTTLGYNFTTFEFPSQKQERKGGWEPSFASNLKLNFGARTQAQFAPPQCVLVSLVLKIGGGSWPSSFVPPHLPAPRPPALSIFLKSLLLVDGRLSVTVNVNQVDLLTLWGSNRILDFLPILHMSVIDKYFGNEGPYHMKRYSILPDCAHGRYENIPWQFWKKYGSYKQHGMQENKTMVHIKASE